MNTSTRAALLVSLLTSLGACDSTRPDGDAHTDVPTPTDACDRDADASCGPVATDVVDVATDVQGDAPIQIDVPASDGSDGASDGGGDGGDAALAPITTAVQGAIIFQMPVDVATGTALTPAQIRARLPMVILARNQTGPVGGLRTAGVAGPFLQYLILNEVHGPAGAGGPGTLPTCATGSPELTYHPYQNNVYMDAGDYCKIELAIRGAHELGSSFGTSLQHLVPTEGWYLHDATGARVCGHIAGDDTQIYCRPNPGDTGFQQFFLARALRELEGAPSHAAGGMDGIYLDNVSLGLGSDSFREFTAASAYVTAVHSMVQVLHTAFHTTGRNYPLYGNMIADRYDTGTEWDAFQGVLEGAMDEYFALNWGNGPWTGTAFTNHLLQSSSWLAHGGVLLDVAQGRDWPAGTPPSGTLTSAQQHDLDFSLASFLLVTDGRHGYYRYFTHNTGYQNYYGSTAYADALGAPMGPRTAGGAGMWTRHFECGDVTVTQSPEQGTITVTPGCRPAGM